MYKQSEINRYWIFSLKVKGQENRQSTKSTNQLPNT